MKHLITTTCRLIMVSALILNLSCSSDDGVSGIDSSLLIGKWSITNLTYSLTEPGGTVVANGSETFDHNTVTVQFNEDGTLLSIDVIEAEWVTGTYAFDAATNTITTVEGSETNIITIVSLTATIMSITLIEEEIEGGVTFINNLTVNFIKNDGTEPIISSTDLIGKWSVINSDSEVIVDTNQDGEFNTSAGDELLFTSDYTNIPVNRWSLEFNDDNSHLEINTFDEDDFNDERTWTLIDGSNFSINDPGGDYIFFHLEVASATTMTASVQLYTSESDGGTVYEIYYIGSMTLDKNNGSELTMAKSDIEAKDWLISDFVETEDGVDVTDAMESPEGNSLLFNSNGTGSLTEPGSAPISIDWYLVDESNLFFSGLIDPGSSNIEEVLLNFTGKSQTGGGKAIYTFTEGWLELIDDVGHFHETIIEVTEQ